MIVDGQGRSGCAIGSDASARGRMQLKLLIGLALSPWPAFASIDCLPFEPERVELSGTLIARDFRGPPNYGESLNDTLERAHIVVLEQETCVRASIDDALNAESFESIFELQVVSDDSAAWLNRKVYVSGTLFSAHSGHHRTPVLLRVTEIRELPE